MRNATGRYFVAVVLLVALFAASGASPLATPAGALSPAAAGDSGEERAHEAFFIDRINDLRRGRGLSTLTVDSELTAQARQWTTTMATDGNLRHAADLSVGVTATWTVLGENVGVHTVHDVDRLFQAFVDSAGHLANLTDGRYNRVGVGVAHAPDGRIWTTHRFMATPDAPSAPPPAPAPAPAPPPEPAPPPPAPVAAPKPPPAPAPVSAPAAAPAAAPERASAPTSAPAADPANPTPTPVPRDRDVVSPPRAPDSDGTAANASPGHIIRTSPLAAATAPLRRASVFSAAGWRAPVARLPEILSDLDAAGL